MPTATAIISAQPLTSPTKTYLNLARTAYPDTTDATLITMARHICDQHTHGVSADDLTGDLAAHLGNQALAHRVIATAITAYCP